MTWDDADKVLLIYVHTHKSLINVYKLYPLATMTSSHSSNSIMISLGWCADEVHFLGAFLIKHLDLHSKNNAAYITKKRKNIVGSQNSWKNCSDDFTRLAVCAKPLSEQLWEISDLHQQLFHPSTLWSLEAQRSKSPQNPEHYQNVSICFLGHCQHFLNI